MHLIRFLALSVLATLLLAACQREAAEPAVEPAASAPPPTAEETTISHYAWHQSGIDAGETTIERAGDGRVATEVFVHWNNREYRLESEFQLDADGMVVAQRITGQTPFFAPVDEEFSYRDGEASWRTVGEHGSARALASGGVPAFYLPTQWGAVGSLEALVRAAAKRIDGNLPLYPDGTAQVEKLTEISVPGPDGEVPLSLYAISGIDFTPDFAWFDDGLALVALDFGRLGMLPQGWNADVLERLGKVQAEQEALRLERLSAELAHPAPGAVVFEKVDVVDVASGELLSARNVRVADGLITQIDSAPIADDSALRIDGSGKTLIPGLWDMHSHHGLDDGMLNIAGGITSVRNLGSVHERMVEQKAKFDAGEVIGPTTYAAAMIDQVGPYANRNPVSSEAQALEYIDRFAGQGYIGIKLYSSIDPAWVPAIAERTHSHGMRLSGHVPAFMSAEQAVRAGYDEIQHINMVFLNFLVGDQGDTRQQLRFTLYGKEAGTLDLDSPEVASFIALLRERGTTIDPTAAIFDDMLTHVPGQPQPEFAAVADHLPVSVRRSLYSPLMKIPDDEVEAWHASAERQSQMLKKLYDAGIPLVAGSDDMAPFTLHRELEVYAEAGIPDAAVLKIATLDAAGVLGVADRTGSIEVGKAADLALVDGNPLEDISAVRNTVLVMKGQTLYRPNELYEAMGVEPFLESISW